MCKQNMSKATMSKYICNNENVIFILPSQQPHAGVRCSPQGLGGSRHRAGTNFMKLNLAVSFQTIFLSWHDSYYPIQKLQIFF
jgi:hypothetical protein